MSVKLEELKSIKLTAKGILVSLDENGFKVQDEKDGSEETISLDEIRDLLVGKSVNLAFANKEILMDE